MCRVEFMRQASSLIGFVAVCVPSIHLLQLGPVYGFSYHFLDRLAGDVLAEQILALIEPYVHQQVERRLVVNRLILSTLSPYVDFPLLSVNVAQSDVTEFGNSQTRLEK